MRIISFIEDREIIKTILSYLGLPQNPMRR